MTSVRYRHTSVTTWVSGAMFGVLLAFACVMVVNLRAHQKTAHALRVLSESYLPLSLMVSEARANAGVYGAMLLRADEPGTRTWLDSAAELRAVPLQRAERAISLALQNPAYASEAQVMQSLRADVQRSRRLVRESRALLSARTDADVVQRVTPIEAENARVLRRVWDQIDHRLRTISTNAEAQERASVRVVIIISVLFLLLGVAAAILIRRLLNPLPQLAARMQKVQAGVLQPEEPPTRIAHTELTELAQQFEAMVQSLRDARAKLVSSERLAAVGKMAAHVAHEVRNPLSSIGLNVDLLAEEVSAERAPEAQKILSAIQKEIERLTEITREYLTFARVPNPKKRSEDIFEVCRDAVELVRSEMAQANINLRIDNQLPAERRHALLDENQIRQVLLNLIRNSKDAHAHDVALRIARSDEDPGVVVDIIDDGSGIAPAAQAQLFEPFHTTKNQGTGLGLALSRQILEAHEGTLTLAQTSASGTTFRLFFPDSSLSVASHAEMR